MCLCSTHSHEAAGWSGAVFSSCYSDRAPAGRQDDVAAASVPGASYHLLEDPDTVARLRADPRGFLDEISLPVILDEIQNVPEILNYVRARIDQAPRKRGQWLLTGSQEAPLMKGVTESMAGRAAVLQLLPFSLLEQPKVSLLRGGFPEVIGRPSAAALWFRSYVQTYLERDVRAVSAIRDLATFRRFLSLLASRCGQLLNRTDLAAPLGVSVPTISDWLSILEVTEQILLVPPFYENFGKRLVKSPKLYFVDSGLASHLLGITSEGELNRSPFLGALFEGFVSRTVTPGMAESLVKLRAATTRDDVTSILVHRGTTPDAALTAIRPGVQAMPLQELLVRMLAGRARRTSGSRARRR